jgi:hypothetical protein
MFTVEVKHKNRWIPLREFKSMETAIAIAKDWGTPERPFRVVSSLGNCLFSTYRKNPVKHV